MLGKTRVMTLWLLLLLLLKPLLELSHHRLDCCSLRPLLWLMLELMMAEAEVGRPAT